MNISKYKAILSDKASALSTMLEIMIIYWLSRNSGRAS